MIVTQESRLLLVAAVAIVGLVLLIPIIFTMAKDAGFWIVKEYLNLTVTQTLRTWTIIETAISVVALVSVMLLNHVDF